MKKAQLALMTLVAVFGINSMVFAGKDRATPRCKEETKKEAVKKEECNKEPVEKAAYLGVATSPIDGVLAAQLDLPKGVGLAVDYIDPESPAAEKLEQHDVLRKVNDQILVNHPQLSVLIRSMKPGEEADIDLLRKGKPMTVKVALAEKELPPLSDEPAAFPRLHINPPRMHSFKFDDKDWWRPQFDMDDFYDNMEKNLKDRGFDRDWMKDMLEKYDQGWLKQLMDEMWGIKQDIKDRLGQPKDSSKQSRSKVEVRSFHSKSGSYSIADDEHSITMTVNNGNKHLTATDKDGKVIFDGPVNTKEEREKIPSDVLKKVRNIEGMRDEIAPDIEDEPKELLVL